MCEYTDVGKILYDWQSLVAGVLAFGAGLLTGKAGVDVLRSAPNALLRLWPVSKRVNKTGVGDDDPSLVEPIEVINTIG